MDKITAEARSRNMSRIRSKNTTPELELRKLLYSQGYRFRIHYPLKGKPDIVFLKKKIAVFVNGCFWHGHRCKLDHIPTSNTDFWKNKIMRNMERDRYNNKILRDGGWEVITLWECKLKENPQDSFKEVQSSLINKDLI